MKKSHRRDVVIARIIFAAAIVLLIAIIVGAALLIRGCAADKKNNGESQVQTESGDDRPQTEGEPSGGIQEEEPATQPKDTQLVVPNPIMRTTTGVNMRTEPNRDGAVITVLEAGTMLEMIGEEAGWAAVDYQGQTGYVSLDYLEEVTGADAEE